MRFSSGGLWQLRLAILAKYSWLGRHWRWCSISEDGAGCGGDLHDTCLDFKLKY